MKNNNDSINQDFLDDIKGIINNARQNAVRSVDFCRVQIIGILADVFLKKNKMEKNELNMVLI